MAPAKLSGVNPFFKVELSQFSMCHENSFKVIETIYVGFFNILSEKSKSGRK